MRTIPNLRRTAALFVVPVLFAAVPSAKGALISDLTSRLVGSDATSTGMGSEFTLTAPASVTDAIAVIGTSGQNVLAADLTTLIYSASGDRPVALLETSAGGTGAAALGEAGTQVTFAFTPTVLPAGSYFLELNYAPTNGDPSYAADWAYTDRSDNTGTDGTADATSFFNGTQYSTQEHNSFAIDGTAVPEPAAASILATAGLLCLGRRRRSDGCLRPLRGRIANLDGCLKWQPSSSAGHPPAMSTFTGGH